MGTTYKPQQKNCNILQEPSVSYMAHNYYEMANARISKKYIKEVVRRAKLSVPELINLLPISIDTYKRKTEFNSRVTEKVLEVEEVYHKGLAAFGDSFYQWMDTTNVALGNIRPKELLQNSFGIRILLDEIGRLEHGILA